LPGLSKRFGLKLSCPKNTLSKKFSQLPSASIIIISISKDLIGSIKPYPGPLSSGNSKTGEFLKISPKNCAVSSLVGYSLFSF